MDHFRGGMQRLPNSTLKTVQQKKIGAQKNNSSLCNMNVKLKMQIKNIPTVEQLGSEGENLYERKVELLCVLLKQKIVKLMDKKFTK